LAVSGLAHESAMVIGAGALTLFTVLEHGRGREHRSARALAVRLTPALAAAALAAAHHWRVHGAMHGREIARYSRPFVARLADVPRILVGDGNEEQIVLLALLALVAGAVVFVKG